MQNQEIYSAEAAGRSLRMIFHGDKISILPLQKLANWFTLASNLFPLCSESPITTETKQHVQKAGCLQKKTQLKPSGTLFRNTEVGHMKPWCLSRKLRRVFPKSRFSLKEYSLACRLHHHPLHVAYPAVY